MLPPYSRVALPIVLIAAEFVWFPAHVAAEVMDKEPTLAAVWAWALAGGALTLFGWRFRWWAGAALAMVPTLYFYALHKELTDPYIGPDIAKEAGTGYVWWSYGAAAAFFAVQFLGIWCACRFHRRESN